MQMEEDKMIESYYKKGNKKLNTLTRSDVEKLLKITEGDILVIPDKIDGITVDAIGINCFNKVVGIKEIIFPVGVIYVQYGAIVNCDVERIAFGRNLEDIDIHCLRTNKNLSCIEVKKGGLHYETIKGNLYSAFSGILYYGCNNDIAKSTKQIESLAFSGSDIESVVIPEKVSIIGNSAFLKCKKLKTVLFQGRKLSKIGNNAFEQCKKLKSINIPGSVSIIGYAAFLASGLTELTFDNREASDPRLSISSRAFMNTKLPTLNLSMVKNTIIGVEAFRNAVVKNLILSGIIELQSQAFCLCNPEEITFKFIEISYLSDSREVLGSQTLELRKLIPQYDRHNNEATYIRHHNKWIEDRFW